MNSLLRVVLAVVGGGVAKGLIVPNWIQSPIGLITGIIFAGIIWWLLGFVKNGSPVSGAWPADFKPTVAHHNIAIDTEGDRIWVRPVSGAPRVVARGGIKGWTREWVDVSNAYGRTARIKNVIVFRTPDMRDPIFKVDFGRDEKSAEEWQARITNWVNE